MSRHLVRPAVIASAALGIAVLTGCSAAAPPIDYPLLAVEEASATEPATALGLDEVGYFVTTVDYGSGQRDQLTAVSLRAIETREPGDWPDLVENPEEFEGYTPVVLIVEQHVLTEVPESYVPQTLDVFPIYDSGEVAPYVVVDFALGRIDDSATCGMSLYEREYFEPVFQYCLIGASEGDEIVGMHYDGQHVGAFTADESTPYYAEPVVWR